MTDEQRKVETIDMQFNIDTVLVKPIAVEIVPSNGDDNIKTENTARLEAAIKPEAQRLQKLVEEFNSGLKDLGYDVVKLEMSSRPYDQMALLLEAAMAKLNGRDIEFSLETNK